MAKRKRPDAADRIIAEADCVIAKRITPKPAVESKMTLNEAATVQSAVMGLSTIYRLRYKVGEALANDLPNDAELFLEAIADIATLHGKRLDVSAGTGLFDDD